MKEISKSVFDTYAIVETGGKQYQAIPGKTIAIEKLEGDAGSSVILNNVLLRKKDGKVDIGHPTVQGASVKANILKHIRDAKKISFVFKRRKKLRTKKGHRQNLTVIRIESI